VVLLYKAPYFGPIGPVKPPIGLYSFLSRWAHSAPHALPFVQATTFCRATLSRMGQIRLLKVLPSFMEPGSTQLSHAPPVMQEIAISSSVAVRPHFIIELGHFSGQHVCCAGGSWLFHFVHVFTKTGRPNCRGPTNAQTCVGMGLRPDASIRAPCKPTWFDLLMLAHRIAYFPMLE